jgi:hypothetical protein
LVSAESIDSSDYIFSRQREDMEHGRSFEVEAGANASGSPFVERKEMPRMVALVSHHDDVHVARWS